MKGISRIFKAFKEKSGSSLCHMCVAGGCFLAHSTFYILHT